MSFQPSIQPDNLFLAALSPLSRGLLASKSIPVLLPVRASLYVAGETPTYAYFITSGMASVVTSMADGGAVEVGLVGREGIVGSLHILGPAHPATSCFIQLEATALRIHLADLAAAFHSSEEIRTLILESIQEQAITLGQLAACNRLHEVEQRLARWLLMLQDRVQSDVLDLTQEFLGDMIGAQRTTVTAAASPLQRAGLIEYSRGHVKILSREGLEAVACECYQISKHVYRNLYRSPVTNGSGHQHKNWTTPTAVA